MLSSPNVFHIRQLVLLEVLLSSLADPLRVDAMRCIVRARDAYCRKERYTLIRKWRWRPRGETDGGSPVQSVVKWIMPELQGAWLWKRVWGLNLRLQTSQTLELNADVSQPKPIRPLK